VAHTLALLLPQELIKGNNFGKKEVSTVKISNALMAGLLLVALGLTSCATLSQPVTEQEEEEAIQTQKDRWQYDFSHDGGDND
jgi:hypothetical protein